MKKENKNNLFKRWWILCEPNKSVWFWQIFFCVLYAALYACMTIFAAKLINCLYNGEWNKAYFWLVIELVDVVVRNVALHFQYSYYAKHCGIIRYNITAKIYNKIMKCEENSIKKFSSEKIINIAQNNMSYAAEFPDYIANILQYMVQVVIAIVTIFSANLYAGLIVATLGVVNYFVYRALNKKLGRIMNMRYEKKDKSFQDYSKILSGKEVINELGAKEIYKDRILTDAKEFNQEYYKYYKTYSFRDNVYYAIWSVVIYAITAFLIYIVSKGGLELSIYLIIVPYLTTCIEKLNNLYTKFGGFENMRVDVDRLNMILSLTDKQLVQYGNVNRKTSGNNLGFIDVSYKSESPIKVNLKNFDISFKMNAVNIIKGERNCGKRAVFDMLRRRVKPDSGVILLDNLNLYDYEGKTFKNHINYCAYNPIFINGTVKENLLVAKSDFEAVKKLVDEFGISEKIESLPQGYDTPISDVKNEETRFWIGLVRAGLSEAKILMVYEYPENVSKDFDETFKNIIATCETDKRTLIVFTHKDNYDDLADMIYEIKNNRVRLVKIKKQKQIKA
jgi:ABC-type bacteriocin/lantibiotic exporter with double-glycine peptidase domain